MLTVCSGPRQLAQFREFRGGSFCENINNVFIWSESLSKRDAAPDGGDTLDWYPTMRFICQAMLQIKQEHRPYADTLASFWECHQHSGVPPTLCNCNARSAGGERYVDRTLHQARTTASKRGDLLLVKLLDAKLLNYPDQFLHTGLRE
jgi:hypothetical protein